jgi:hypothetical protein
MATVAQIIAAQQAAIQELTDRQTALNKLLKPGQTTGTVVDAIDDIGAKKLAIIAEKNKAILASADLAAALTAMQQATINMQTVAANMKNVAGVATNIATYIGYAGDVLSAAKSVTGGTGPG